MLTTGPLRPIYICGSTATGKTAVSIALANLIGGEIVNGDAYQVYSDIDTISAAPSKEEQFLAPHHLFGVLKPDQEFDAQTYLNLVKPVIAEIQQRKRIPIIVGGSGMYLKFLTHGPSNLPAGDDALREQLELKSDQELVEQFTELDPVGASETNLKNRRYVIRALEICLLSGQRMSQLKTDWKNDNSEKERHLRGYVLNWDREVLRERILLRTKIMLEQGAVEEVCAVEQLSATCIKAIGVRDILAFKSGEITEARLEELIFFATCQYAKRQNTWFSKETWLESIPVTSSSNPEHIAQGIADRLK